MKLILLLCIVFIKASEGCNHQNDEKLSKFHTLIRGNEISIRSTGSSQERWHIIRDSICKAKLTCKNFYIPPSEDCLKSSLEVIDGDLIKLRFCGYSSILEYEAKGKTVLDIRSTIKDGFGHVDCKLNCIENLDPATTTTVSTTPQSTTTTIENRQCQCGRSLVSERIINGQSVMNPGTYPWQALLIVNGRFTCGGSLISPKFVLTAAHCTRLAQASSIEVVLGRHNFTGETSTELNEQRRKVSQVHIHPQFNPSMLDNDFSLLELESEIEVTDYVGSVCLPEDADEEFGASTLAVATGWGSMHSSAMVRPQILQYIRIPTWNKSDCGKFPPEQITENMICAGGDDKDACQGDSGGPLVTEISAGGQDKFLLIGVTSWGVGCGTPDYPGVYARVTTALPFLNETLKGSICF